MLNSFWNVRAIVGGGVCEEKSEGAGASVESDGEKFAFGALG